MAPPFAPSAVVELTEAQRFDWLRLARCENIGPRTFDVLLSRYGGARAALEALPELIRQGKPGRPIKIATVEETEQELELMRRAGAVFIGLCEPDYPPLLRRIDTAPPLIAARGDLASLRRSKVAIVGSRNASAAGLALTEQLARGIARAGHVIVSGLARGIDARAHQASIETGTIAVLAGGLGNIYPANHELLLERLLERGAAISEMPFGWEARGRDFPRRNRIVAGLSRGIVVVEAARRSGSLITAKFAAEQGREIFAAPGSPLDPRAEGANDLLREGATFCTNAQDVIEALAKQNLSQERPGFGFFEPDFSAEFSEPLWDELDLPELARAAAAPAPLPPTNDIGSLIEREEAWEEFISNSEADGGEADGDRVAAPPAQRSRTEIVQRVIELLGPTPVSVDEIVRASEAPARDVRTILFDLELAGRLERHGGDLVSLI
ncbi:DNA-processing protein DprA [Methylocapsa aurea]|uniref:DNA-processing protein DprA n=1 Tax=Methylocapsa aurea TaxID=663610 RepID=UPI00056A5A34|nr:DNA-processing protein DprA [Methylocapsa aurea]